MVNVVQAIFGAIAPGDLRASMVSSGTTGAVAAESEGLMQDFRAGQMIQSTPRMLTYMQLIAVPVGSLALAFMYPLLRDTIQRVANELAGRPIVDVDSASAMAEAAREQLGSGPTSVPANRRAEPGRLDAFTTDISRLTEIAPRFLGEPLSGFELVDL